MVRRVFAYAIVAAVGSVWSPAAAPVAAAGDVYLADAQAFPGKIWSADSREPERLVHQREGTANPAFPNAAMNVASVAVTPDGEVFFCSGLDGYVLQLLDGRHEALAFEHDGQIRDVATTDEPHVVYFSVVPTPQNGEPLADGKIFRRDLWEGRGVEIATVRQGEVGGAWWGTFAIRHGTPYLATLEPHSRLFKLTSAGPEPAFTDNEIQIRGLAVMGREFLTVDESGAVLRTSDFVSFVPVHRGEARFTDAAAALRPSADP